MEIKFSEIGFVKNNVEIKKDTAWGEVVSQIILNDRFSGGLKGLEDFSHVIIIYYLDKAAFDIEKYLQRRPQNRNDMPLVGIFSQRGKRQTKPDRHDLCKNSFR